MKIQWISPEEYKERLTAKNWYPLLFTLSFIFLPLIILLPSGIGAVLIPILIIKWASVHYQKPRLATYSIFPIFFLGIAISIPIFWTESITMGFLALLIMMSSCKLLEARNVRDMHILFLNAILLCLANLMFSQSFLIFIYVILAVLLSFYSLSLITERNSEIKKISGFGSLLSLLLLSLPIVFVLFFTAPRIAPIWGIQRQNNQGITGLPNEMSMDGISHLAQSSEIAFRVRFENDEIPPAKYLYWRGPVLWNYENGVWRQRRGDYYNSREALFTPDNSDDYRQISYTIRLAKNDIRMLTALDMPLNVQGRQYYMGASRQIYLAPVVRGEQKFRLNSVLNYALNPERISAKDYQDATAIPANLNLERTKRLAQRLWSQSAEDPEKFAQAFMQFIRNEDFHYTLDPYEGADDIERFLFENQSRGGFCQHYSNAFALTARLAGIPARIVIGYLGGRVNELSEDFVVREENAHAWVELWIPDKGWVRYDPTAAVSPARVDSSGLNQEVLSEGDNKMSIFTRLAQKYRAFALMRDSLDAAQSFWQNQVINFNEDKQIELFNSFGISSLKRGLAIILVFIFSLALILLCFIFWEKKKQKPQDPLSLAAYNLLKRLENKGMGKYNSESFSTFLRRIAQEKNLLNQDEFNQTAIFYENLRFREKGNLEETIKAIKKLRVVRS